VIGSSASRGPGAPDASLEQLCVNALRGLAIDQVQAAKSGHPGLPLGAAAMAYALWTGHLRHNPKDPKWFDRDRFVLSAGHGSALLYGLLYLSGYDLPLEELKRFRQFGSKTPGHPENHLTPGVEMATGPLGQGFATAVGMAMAERYLAARYNDANHTVVDHRTFVICSDGDLMEGVAAEAASLAGHLGLAKLVALYDSNRITIDGRTDMAFTEDVAARFRAYGWNVSEADGLDVDDVDRTIRESLDQNERPSLIVCRTTIGYGSPNKADSSKSHGAALGEEEVRLTKQALGLDPDLHFHVPDEALACWREAVERGASLQAEWQQRVRGFGSAHPEKGAEFERVVAGELPDGWQDAVPSVNEKVATRVASGRALNALAPILPNLVGGSADLAESNNTMLEGGGDFQADSPAGRNIWYGVREHAMAAATNGMNLHGGMRAYAGTFLIFSDYCRPSIRLAALMECPSVFVMTHDSIGLGEDGPTHQPIEQLAGLRAIPNLNVMRPADGNETAACWILALERTVGPSLLALTRQALPPVTPEDVKNHPCRRGGYVLAEASDGAPQRILVATGSEVSLALEARERMEADGLPTRVVSLPSWLLFEEQEAAYRESVLPKNVFTVSVEAGATLGWARYAQAHVGLDRFGVSAPGEVAMRELGFTPERVAEVARQG
jgi:transketolase